MKFIVCLFIKKRIILEEDIKKYLNDIRTYIYHTEKLIIFNMVEFDQSSFFEELKCFNNIEYANCKNYGQVANYKIAMNKAIKEEATFCTILETDYFYLEDGYLLLKNELINNTNNLPSILTPFPTFTCEDYPQKEVKTRPIKGSHLVGAMINVNYYKESQGFVEDYYQTTFDYDYCINERLSNHPVLLMNNVTIKNRNFKIIERKILQIKLSAYERSVYNLYYETRNRLYLWEKYKKLDPDYVKLDKKQYKAEMRELRTIDKAYKSKKNAIIQAKEDYKKGIKGKQFPEITL